LYTRLNILKDLIEDRFLQFLEEPKKLFCTQKKSLLIMNKHIKELKTYPRWPIKPEN